MQERKDDQTEGEKVTVIKEASMSQLLLIETAAFIAVTTLIALLLQRFYPGEAAGWYLSRSIGATIILLLLLVGSGVGFLWYGPWRMQRQTAREYQKLHEEMKRRKAENTPEQ